jgi:hypothetical protein
MLMLVYHSFKTSEAIAKETASDVMSRQEKRFLLAKTSTERPAKTLSSRLVK